MELLSIAQVYDIHKKGGGGVRGGTNKPNQNQTGASNSSELVLCASKAA